MIHPNLPDVEGQGTFKGYYWMHRSTLEYLVNRLSQHPVYQQDAVNAWSAWLQICTAIWRFANQHVGYREAEQFLGISHGSYHNFTMRFIQALEDMEGHRVAWPTDAQVAEVAEQFQYGLLGSDFSGRGGLPDCVGAIDGKSVRIHKPAGFGGRFLDRKSHFSMNTTAICDANRRFTFVHSGESGM